MSSISQYLDAAPRRGRIQIIPMIDIMLFLLVFFVMISLEMVPAMGLKTALPQSSQAQHLPHPKIAVVIRHDGSLWVHDKQVRKHELVLRFEAAGPKTAITIEPAHAAPVQALIKVMDAARKANIKNVGIATLNKASPDSGG